MKKVLIVDDSLFMRKVLANLLLGEYEVREADSGAKAIEQVEKESPDRIAILSTNI